MSPGNGRRPASAHGTGSRVTGRITLNLQQSRPENMAEAGTVEGLPPGITVILRVDSSPDPAVVDRLRRFGSHVDYDVHGRTAGSTSSWVRALRGGEVLP